MAYRWSEEKNR